MSTELNVWSVETVPVLDRRAEGNKRQAVYHCGVCKITTFLLLPDGLPPETKPACCDGVHPNVFAEAV